MPTPTDRFDAAFNYVSGFNGPIDLTEALGWDDERLIQSVAACEGVHIDDAKRPTSKALGLLCVSRLYDPAGRVHSRITDRVELYRDSAGEVVPNFTGKVDIYSEVPNGVNHGYPDTEFEVPLVSRELALNSALAAIEQAIDAHRILAVGQL